MAWHRECKNTLLINNLLRTREKLSIESENQYSIIQTNFVTPGIATGGTGIGTFQS